MPVLISFISALTSVGLFILTFRQGADTQKQIALTTEQLKTTDRMFVATERPWLSVKTTVRDLPLLRVPIGGRSISMLMVPSTVEVTNSGRSPAQNVRTRAVLKPMRSLVAPGGGVLPAAEAALVERAMRTELEDAVHQACDGGNPIGGSVMPGQTHAVERKDSINAVALSQDLYVLVCVVYRSDRDAQEHHTTTATWVRRTDGQPLVAGTGTTLVADLSITGPLPFLGLTLDAD